MDHGPPRPVVLSLRGCRSPGVARHTGMPRRKDHGPPRRVVLWAFEFHCTARDPLRCRQCAIFFYKKILHLQSQLLLCLLSKKKLQSILLEWHFKSCLKARLHRFKITVYFAQHSATEELLVELDRFCDLGQGHAAKPALVWLLRDFSQHYLEDTYGNPR